MKNGGSVSRFGGLVLASGLLIPLTAQPQDASKAPTKRVEYFMGSSGIAVGPDGSMRMSGVGQALATESRLVTSGSVSSISPKSIQVQAGKIDRTFRITPATRLCADGKPIKAAALKAGDNVSVVTSTAEQDAISIRKGLVGMAMQGGGLRDYDCK